MQPFQMPVLRTFCAVCRFRQGEYDPLEVAGSADGGAALCACVYTKRCARVECKWIVRPLHNAAWTQAVRM
jgi:hypothetical protein